MNTIIPYKGQRYHIVKLFGLTRRLPIVSVEEGLWIASNADLMLGDIEFISRASKVIADKLSSLSIDVIVSPETKSIALAFNVGRLMGLDRIIIARKSVKSYMHDYIIESLKSITTREKQILVLTREDSNFLKDKSVCLLDDVVSTGGTINALERLVSRSRPYKLYKVAIWREGPWYNSKDLIYFDILPIYVDKKLLYRFRGALKDDQYK